MSTTGKSAPILVLGSLGQVGTELMRRQSDATGPLLGLDIADIDIADEAQLARTFARVTPRLVINAAAYTAVDRAESEAAQAFSANRDGPAGLAASCAAAGVPLLHISTDYVFDGEKQTAYREDDATRPLGVYGASKLAGEDAVRRLCPRHVILRTAWVFSAQGGNFVKTILRLSAERPELRVVDDQTGGPTSAAAIAEALLKIAAAVTRGVEAWGTYHFCGAPVTTWCRFARAIVEDAQRHGGRAISVAPITTADYPLPARRPANSALDCHKIAATFGIGQPDWRRDLGQVVDALLARGIAA